METQEDGEPLLPRTNVPHITIETNSPTNPDHEPLLASSLRQNSDPSIHAPAPSRPLHRTRQSSLIIRTPDEVRTPRTANRVRFDLEDEAPEEIENGAQNGHGNGKKGKKAIQLGWLGNLDEDDFMADESNQTHDESNGNADYPTHGTRKGRSSRESMDFGGMERHRLLDSIESGEARAAMDLDVDDKMDVHPRAKSGLRSAFMNMANSIIGAGIIGQPYALKQAGLLSGVILLCGLTVVVDWTIRLIVINSKLSGATSFQATMEHCFGRAGLWAISIAQWAFAFGGMVAFCVIVGDTIPHVFTAVFPDLPTQSFWWLLSDRRFIIILFVLGVSYPLCLYRDIAKLAKASTLALVSMGIIILAIITQGARVDPELRGPLSGSLLINGGIFQAIGVISFAFVCHHNSLLIYGSLEKPTIDRFALVTHYSTAISLLACLAMALAGFLTFGSLTDGNVLNNFPSDNLMVNIARLCFGLNMLTTLPLECFVCREVMEELFWPRVPYSRMRHILLSSGLIFASVAISLATCDLGAVFELIGATSACSLAYIFPPLCYLKLSSRRARGWKVTALCYATITFGVAVLIISLVMSIVQMVSGSAEPKKCQ